MIWTTRRRSEGPGALSYFEEGSGPPLILIHGVGLRAEAWCATLPLLAERYRVICLDMPGHGASPLCGSNSLAMFVRRCADFIAEREVAVRLAGHSMGALLAVELALCLPQRVTAVAALNMIYRRTPDAAAAVLARAEALSAGQAADPSPTLRRWFGPAPEGGTKMAAAACTAWLTGGDPAGYAMAYRIFAQNDGPTDEALAKLTSPALFVTGADDPNSTPAMSRALASRCGGRFRVVDGAAHMMPMTHGSQVAQALTAHFETVTKLRLSENRED